MAVTNKSKMSYDFELDDINVKYTPGSTGKAYLYERGCSGQFALPIEKLSATIDVLLELLKAVGDVRA